MRGPEGKWGHRWGGGFQIGGDGEERTGIAGQGGAGLSNGVLGKGTKAECWPALPRPGHVGA